MPNPLFNETRDDFMERCIPIVLEDGTADDNDQAVAACSIMFDDKKYAPFMDIMQRKADPKKPA